jgi:chromosomal replication initiation ATPase DnaA
VSQFVLDFARRTALGRSDFLLSACNAAAIGWIDRWPAWPSPVLVLHGPRESGKTHLAHLWCERAAARLIPGPMLHDAKLRDVFDGGGCRVAVDDADQAPELALLQLHNYCSERGGYLLATAQRPPGAWEIGLADLCSRLRAATVAGIAMPDDALLGAVLVKHFSDRQLRVGPELIAYLTCRIERSFAAAAAVVAALDTAALAGRQPVSIPLARKVLEARSDQFLPPGSESTVT